MRFAVLGCGSIGRRHLRNLRALGQDDLSAFDPDPGALKSVEDELGIKSFGVLADVWNAAPDTVLVTASSSLHVELALNAARHKCHLFVEKPLSHSLDGVDELMSIATGSGLITMVGCNMRFHPGPALVKRLIEEGAAGEILGARVYTGSYLPEWRPWLDYRKSYSAAADMGGGALLDCIHEIDLALWYFGAARVRGAAIKQAESLGIAVEGMAEVLLQHETGVLSSVHLNFVQRDYHRGCFVIGEKGTIYWNFGSPVVELRTGQDAITRYELDPAWHTDQMYVDEMSEFIRCAESGKQTTCPLEHGKAALEIVLAAKELASKS
jgi:predicted dehydrogenase